MAYTPGPGATLMRSLNDQPVRPSLLFSPSQQPVQSGWGSPISQTPQDKQRAIFMAAPPTPGSYYISPHGGTGGKISDSYTRDLLSRLLEREAAPRRLRQRGLKQPPPSPSGDASQARNANLSSNLPDVLPPPPTRSIMDPNISSTPAPLDITGLPYPTPGVSPGVERGDRGAIISQSADYLLSDRAQDPFRKTGQAADGASVSGARDGTVAGHDDTVTVFGFTQEDSALVLRELQECGRIVNYGAFAPGRVNWLHVNFSSRHEAQRALLKNGMQLGQSLIVGVRALDPAQRAVVSSRAAENPPMVPASAPAPPQYQRLAASATSDLQALTLQQGPRKSTLGKIIHYVVGL